ncbi:MAG: PAS domain-containing protein, partial [Pseudomonadota bacterium]|nr:PAS domain-containing protein [Pseudomonadota bacterium]
MSKLHNNLYIVALGAAAGSLEALKQFFQTMPLEAPFAFVVISVDYSSQQLAQQIKRPVTELQAGMTLRAAQVYLLTQPMTLKATKVYKCPKTSLIIDTFLHALAQEQGAQAIAIILSGNGNDGCQGISRIKQQNGMVIIQTPSSAQFNSMPQSALNSGQFDWVLLPAAMPTALLQAIYPHQPDSERHYIAQLEQTLAATRQALQATAHQLEVAQTTEEQLCAAHNARYKHAELALRHSEERLQLVTSIGQIGICEWEIESNDLFWDEMTFQLYGLDSTQCSLSYETWYNSLHPEDQQAVEAQLKSILVSEQQCFDLHFRIVRPDGNLRHIHARIQIRRDPKGQALSLLGINWDVTEEIQARQALQESEERFRLITETVQDVFWMSTPGVQKMLYVSPAYEQIWGYSCASLYQNPRSFFDAVHPEDKEQLIKGLTEHAHGKWMFEYRIVTPQGAVRWIRDRGYPIVDATGELRLMTGTASDITAIKQTEQLLKNTQRLAHIG